MASDSKKSPRRNEPGGRPGSPRRRARNPVLLGLAVVAVTAGTVVMWLPSRDRSSAPAGGQREPQTPPPGPAPGAGEAMSPARAKGGESYFHKLGGKWVRPDGGYVLELRNVQSDGRLEAGYYNPRPIHVAKAEGRLEGGTTQLFVELQDEGYPGSTYTLSYEPSVDRLYGVYYQATLQQRFEVVFVRTE